MDEQALLEADVAARRDALDVSRSFIVQAPAGSGKTELLIQRYLHLLSIVDEPEEVLAITFTRKAAAEMRKRVLRALQGARDGQVADQPHEQITLDAAHEVLSRDADRDWRLIRSPTRLRIQTLDSFSAGVARQLPLTSGLGGLNQTIQDDVVDAVCRRAATATLDWLVGEDESGAAVEHVLRHLDNNTGTYVSYLSRMLQGRDQWLDITGSGDVAEPDAVRRRLERNLADIVRHELLGLRRALESTATSRLPALAAYAARNLADAGKIEHAVAACLDMDDLPSAAPGALNEWRGLAELLLTKEGDWRKTVNVSLGFPTGDDGQKADWLDLIHDLREQRGLQETLQRVRLLPDAHYDDAQWQTLLALFRVLPLAVSELKRLFAEQGVCDHTEIALAAAAALGSAERPGDTALLLDYRIRHLLVDEMQDTSISQYQMLETLTAGWEAGDGRTFFCVGDPMQSIYRFRNAEVGQFLRAQHSGLGGLSLQPLTLRRNFRSGENLVHWFNTVFGQVFPLSDDIATGAVSYSDSVPVHHLGGQGDFRVHPLFDADVYAEARRTTDVVQECLDADDGSIAILVRSRTQLAALLMEMRSRGVDHRAIEIDRLTDLPEIIDVLALTRAICHYDDRAAWLALLRAPWIGLDWTDLHGLVEGAPGETVWTLLQDQCRARSLSEHAQRVLPTFVEHLDACLRVARFDTLRDRVELAWYRLGGPGYLETAQQLANVYRYLDVLEKNEEAGNLADPAELVRILEAERVSSQGEDGCRVQVMTMHKAKGLEFDHVILPSLGRFTTGGRKSVLSWLNVPAADGGQDMIISPVGPGYELQQDPLHNYIERALKSSDQLEQDRLLYVACTRAKKSLHLVGSVACDDKDGFRAPRNDSLLGRLWVALDAVYAEAFENRTAMAGGSDGDVQTLVPPRLRRGEPDWRITDPPSLPRPAKPPLTESAVTDVEFYWVGRAARQAGTIVHRWLHRFVEQGAWPAAGDITTLAPQSRRWAVELGAGDDDIDIVCERALSALRRTLTDERGQWLLRGHGHVELPLTGVGNDGPVSIVIDRVLIDDDGAHWIVDYKTSTHEGGDLAGFLEQEAVRYAGQLARYRNIYAGYSGARDVRTALYFPLLQEFLEVG